MTKRVKSAKPGKKASKPGALRDLKPDAVSTVRGGKGITVNTRRNDPYKNFNF